MAESGDSVCETMTFCVERICSEHLFTKTSRRAFHWREKIVVAAFESEEILQPSRLPGGII